MGPDASGSAVTHSVNLPPTQSVTSGSLGGAWPPLTLTLGLQIIEGTARTLTCPVVNLEQISHQGLSPHRGQTDAPCPEARAERWLLCGRPWKRHLRVGHSSRSVGTDAAFPVIDLGLVG